MATVKELIERLERNYDPNQIMASHLWVTEDVDLILEEMSEDNYDGNDDNDRNKHRNFWINLLTKEEKDLVIENVDHNCDSEYGITWNHLQWQVDEILKDKPKQCCSCEKNLLILKCD